MKKYIQNIKLIQHKINVNDVDFYSKINNLSNLFMVNNKTKKVILKENKYNA